MAVQFVVKVARLGTVVGDVVGVRRTGDTTIGDENEVGFTLA
jgi:hypothetical protein